MASVLSLGKSSCRLVIFFPAANFEQKQNKAFLLFFTSESEEPPIYFYIVWLRFEGHTWQCLEVTPRSAGRPYAVVEPELVLCQTSNLIHLSLWSCFKVFGFYVTKISVRIYSVQISPQLDLPDSAFRDQSWELRQASHV